MGLTLEDDAPGYEPHDVNITFDNRYGVCRDKAALLVSLLRIAGITAYPVLIHVGGKMDKDVPLPYFNHAIVAAEGGKGDSPYILMDPVDESSRDLMPSYRSDCSYLAANPSGDVLRTSPVLPVEENMLRIDSTGTLSQDGGILLASRFAFNGINDTALRHGLLKMTPKDRRRAFESFLRSAASGAELLSLEIRPADLRDTDVPLSAETMARLPAAVMRGETRDVLTVPFITKTLSVANALLDDTTALERRRFPLVLTSTAGTCETLAISLGDEALGKPVFLPLAQCVTNTPGFLFERSMTATGGVLTAVRRMELRDVNFEVEAYDGLRNARKEVETADRAQPLFAVREDDNAHIRILDSRKVVHFKTPFSWVSTNVLEKRILTYRGKKANAELKFNYAPCTRSVELVSAVVSNADGRVFAVSPKEINTMDCGWASSAPRYPTSKILVANLPGVEIGSVIRTVVVRTVTNSPTAYTEQITFGGKEPYDHESYEYHVPPDMRKNFKVFEDLKDAGVVQADHEQEAGVFRWSCTKPSRVPDEPSQPPLAYWRPAVTVSAADWKAQGTAMLGALALARDAGAGKACGKGRELVAGIDGSAERIRAIRAWITHNMRVTGPGLFELPFDRAFTPPDRSMSDAYASGADRMNLLYSMLEGAGFKCSFVFVADTAQGFTLSEEERRRTPRPSSFNALLIIARDSEGRTFHVAGENEYAPPEVTSREDDDFYDPVADRFGKVELPEDSVWRSKEDSNCRITVRENGSADFEVRNLTYGPGVGGFRKRFEEMRPEPRSRFFQQLVGGLAENATATSELVTDTKSYPAELSFSAYVADFAVVQDDVLTLTIPDFTGSLFQIGEGERKSPLAVNGRTAEVDTYEIVLPPGYTEVEHLPDSLKLANPRDGADMWLTQDVTCGMKDGRLHVTVRRRQRRVRAIRLPADYGRLLREWNRIAASQDARTLMVRRH